MPNRESGQAAVEAALVLPLTVFLVLGTMQLFLLLQGRILAEYAAFRAVRAGAVNYGDCTRMEHAAIGSLLPTFDSFMGHGSGTPAQKLAAAFAARRDGFYNPGWDGGQNEPVVWILRESPNALWVRGQGGGQQKDFDNPLRPGPGAGLVRLEIRMVYWMPLKIPFADWVMSRMFLAQYGFQDYDHANPLMETQTAHWTQEVTAPVDLDQFVREEWIRRVRAHHYVFPIHATATMRMMTPVKAVHFARQHCAPLCTRGQPCP